MKGITGRYSLRGPCSNCPFRSDQRFHLHPDRVEEIADAIQSGAGFSCHKTNDFDDGRAVETNRTRECGGMMATVEREGHPTQMMRIAERIGMYDASKIDPDAPVYDSIAEWREAML